MIARLRRLRPRSIRARLTMLGSLVLLAGFAVGAFVYGQLLESRLEENLDTLLATEAADLAAAVDSGGAADRLVDARGPDTVIAIEIDGAVAASRGVVDPAEVLSLPDGFRGARVATIVEADHLGDDTEPGDEEQEGAEREEIRLAVAAAGSVRVALGAERDSIDASVGDASALLAVGIPLLTAAGAALLWFLTARTLRPVEELRVDAQAIADGAGAGRVGEPGGGDELDRLAVTLNDMLARLEESSLALRRFVSDASHEIRSPIAGIRARLETGRPDDWAAVQGDVVDEVERIESILDDLTYLARSDEGRVAVGSERVELDEAAFAEVARLRRRGRVRVDVDGIGPAITVGDTAHLRRVLRNLVDNAERHAASAVAIAVTSLRDGSVRLAVDDDGPGIPTERRSEVFERFVRLDEGRDRSSGGTGLGLAIVRDIVVRHGGTVEVDTAPLGGARLVVHLPGGGTDGV